VNCPPFQQTARRVLPSQAGVAKLSAAVETAPEKARSRPAPTL